MRNYLENSGDEEQIEQMEKCPDCGENAWDGYICHDCGYKDIGE